MAFEGPRPTLTDWPPAPADPPSSRSWAVGQSGADGYRAHCASCGAESGPNIDRLPRATFAADRNGDLVMRMTLPVACSTCGCSDVEIGLRRRRAV